MDQYYQNLYTTIAYNWIGSLDHAKKGRSSKSICFFKKNFHGKISFFEHSVIELMVEDINTKETIFYLHFEIKNLRMLIENIRTFFKCLNQSNKQSEKQSIGFNMNTQINILLTCTTGLTTSYYAYLLEDYFQKNHLDITIDAVGYQELERIQNRYDYIFVAPQISYQYINLHERYGDKVFLIDSYDFATGNIDAVLNNLKER